MEPEKKPAWDADLNLQPVVSKYQVQGGALRDEASGIVERTGLTRLNREGSDASDLVAERSGFTMKNYVYKWFADPKKRVVVGYVVDPTTDGAVGIRRSSDEKIVSFHLGGVFKDYPGLRPSSPQECGVFAREDSKGEPCLVITLGPAKAKIKGAADAATTSPRRTKRSAAAKPVAPAQPESEPKKGPDTEA